MLNRYCTKYNASKRIPTNASPPAAHGESRHPGDYMLSCLGQLGITGGGRVLKVYSRAALKRFFALTVKGAMRGCSARRDTGGAG
jgi:hypothetical protein